MLSGHAHAAAPGYLVDPVSAMSAHHQVQAGTMRSREPSVRARELLYRISSVEDWKRCLDEGELPPTSLDARDGFVHLSTISQVAPTLARHFAGRDDLVLLTVDVELLLDGSLRFEAPERGGPDRAHERFPHYYGEIPRSAVIDSVRLMPGEGGVHRLPAALVREAERERERENLGIETLWMRVVWDPTRGIALLEYPRATRIEDEAGMLALEAELERRLEALTAGRGKIPLVIGVDNLWVAPKLVRRYRELAEKLTSRAFARVARWSSSERTRQFFAHHNVGASAPASVFDSRERAIAFVLDTGPDPSADA